MRTILRERRLRLVFGANLVSMLGSGMNSAAVTWYVLQATRSEVALGTLMVVTTIPALLMLPFTGVIIDREDRRRLVMLLDAGRALIILTVALLAFGGQVRVWHLYLMNMLVAAGFWMFWPTVTALIQELTPEGEFVHANTFLLAGLQGGWLIAGAIVGFVYNHIGLGGVLLIDCLTYLVSFVCYLAVRKGRHVVARPEHLATQAREIEGVVARFWHELQEGMVYLKQRPYLVLLGTSWALFIAAMLTQGVITAPLSERILHGGAVGYGWLNGGWGVGAFLSAFYTPLVIRTLEPRRAVGVSMAVLAASLTILPFSHILALAVLLYMIMGSARGVGGIAISSTMMEMIPQHFMGRVQNTFYFAGTCFQMVMALLVGGVAHRLSLAAAFAMVGGIYGVACLAAMWPAEKPSAAPQATVAD